MSRKFEPSDEQKLAIGTRGNALLISAGAGSGKTRVLTERLLSYLNDAESPCNISEFLIITYTRAAAAELRERIRGAIAEELAADPSNRRLRRQAALVYSAQIDTIHGFCASLVRENAHLLELSPDFRIAEADETALIEAVVMERVLDARYEQIDEFTGFEALVDSLSPGRDDERLGELVMSLYRNLRSHDDESGWLAATLRELDAATYSDVSETPWGKVLIKKAQRFAAYWTETFDAILLDIADDEPTMKKYGRCFAEVSDALSLLLEPTDNLTWDRLRAAAQFAPPRPSGRNTEEGAAAQAAWKEFGKRKKKLTELFYAPSDEILDDMRAVHGILTSLFTLVSDFSEAFTAEKKRRRVVDFSDLEHYSLRLLTDGETREPTRLARDISLRYKEIMVDEYQDVSMIQERIFNAVSREGTNLVTVGDMRQSIYRFRLAEPSIFQNKYSTYPENQLVRLTKNFRSREALLAAVNHVFTNVMSREFGEMEYTEREFLYHGTDAAAGGSKPELVLIATGADTPETDEDAPEKDALSKQQVEAQYIATRIRELVEDADNPCDYRGCVILMRAMTNAGVYRAALTGAGIPVTSPPGESYMDSAEVELALAFLSIVDNPHNDIPLAAVLRSGLGGFVPDELADIRLCGDEIDRTSTLFTALEHYAEVSEKARCFLNELREYRRLAPEYGAERTLWRLYNRRELPALAAALPNGTERRDNLMRLIRETHRAAGVGYGSVAEFLRYVQRVRASGAKPAADDAGTENAVRIMTIHKSKGLEFGVVFLADMSHKIRKTDEKELVMFHRELGVGLKRVDLQRKIAYSTLPRIAITEKLNDEQMSEELRVLYVAMTRSHDKLIITYAANDASKDAEMLLPYAKSPVSPYVLSHRASLGAILMLAALTPSGEEHFVRRYSTAAEIAEAYERPSLAAEEVCDTVAAEEDLPPQTVEYAHSVAVALPSKLTVTELKNRAADAELTDESETNHRRIPLESTFERPAFITDATAKRTLRGAERGTALHLVLRHLELREYDDTAELRAAVEVLHSRGLLTAEQCAAVDEGALLEFFASDLGRRIAAAQEVYREFKFSLLVRAEEFYDGGGEDEILFQGCVDLAFVENGALTIVDFKSDRLRGRDDIATKTVHYEPQLRAYARAMERITGLQAAECVIYFLEKSIAVSLNR